MNVDALRDAAALSHFENHVKRCPRKGEDREHTAVVHSGYAERQRVGHRTLAGNNIESRTTRSFTRRHHG